MKLVNIELVKKSIVLCLLSLFVSFSFLYPLPTACQLTLSNQPKLVLVIVVDQFCFDYLYRYHDKFTGGGFKFLLDNGADFLNCHYQQVTTLTAVGHSIISTGAYPWSTGIIGNEWLDRKKGHDLSATADDQVMLIGGSGPGASCRNMLGTTIGDEMRLTSNFHNKVITLSLKDRAALLLAGRLATGAYWFDDRSGNFVSSSQFAPILPEWIQAFNDKHYADQYFGRAWQRLLSESSYTASTQDDYPYERSVPGDGRVFPHIMTGSASSPGQEFYNTFSLSPSANHMLADLACQAIEKEHLGQGKYPDFLGISFSSVDYVGHGFGPYSQEEEDMILRLDQALAQLLQFVDKKVGLSSTLVVFTADHGVMPIPEFLKEKGLDAGRIDPKAFAAILDTGLDQKLVSDDWIEAFDPPNLYLNLNTIDKQKYRQPDVEAIAAKLAHSIPGIAEVYTAFQFFMNQLPTSPLTESARRSYFWGRSGELFVIPKPGYIFSPDLTGTSHGSPYSYDTQVPLIIVGPSILPGRYAQRTSPADIAPTISALLHIATPALSEGRVLSEAIGNHQAQVYGPPAPSHGSNISDDSTQIRESVSSR